MKRFWRIPEESISFSGFNSLPHDKILVLSKLKAFAEDKIDVTRAITKRDHTPQQLLLTKQINVTGMQNK